LSTDSDRPAKRRFLSNVHHAVWPDPVSVNRLPALDSLRGPALLSILATHLYFGAIFDNGYLGLTIFFVLLGYLITVLLLEQSKHGVFISARFMYRHYRRLVPPLAMVTVFSLPLTPQVSGTHALSAATGLKGLEAYRPHGHAFADSLGHTWSHTVEFTLYSVAGITITAARSGRGRRLLGHLVRSTFALPLTSLFVVRGSVDDPLLPEDLRFCSPFLRRGEPPAEMVLALASHERKTPSRWAALSLRRAGVAVLCPPRPRIRHRFRWSGSHPGHSTHLPINHHHAGDAAHVASQAAGDANAHQSQQGQLPRLLVHLPVYSAAQTAGLRKITRPLCLAGTVVPYVLLWRVLLLGRPRGALASSVTV